METSIARRSFRLALPWLVLLAAAALLLPVRGALAQGPAGAAGSATVDGEAGGAATAAAGDAAGPADEGAPYDYRDELQRDTPRGAVIGYLKAGREGDWERAARYLDLSRLPPADRGERGPRLARHLKQVLDRELWVEPESLADVPAGKTEDGLPAGTDAVGGIRLGDHEVPIRVQRVREDGERVWKISAATVGRIDELWQVLGYGPLEEWLPRPFFELRLFEIELWQWIGLVVLLLAAWLVSWLVARAILAVVQPLSRRTLTTMDDRLLADGAPPLRFLSGLGLCAIGLPLLRLAVPAEHFFYNVLRAATALAVIWLAMRVVDIASQWMRERLEEGGRHTAVALLPIGRRTIKVALVALGVLAVLQNLGLNVTALLTGLGVGGLAVALAAQKTLENLFGGISLAVDQPVRVGEFCRFGDKLGTVEDIGLRSTRVRTLDRTLVTVPNSDFSSMQLENFAKRDRMRLILTLGLRYETTADQLRYVLVELRKLLLSHPRISPDPARVRFVGFGAFSLDLELFAYVETPDYNEFLAIREDLFLRIMAVVEESGSDFAFPSQTTYIERGGGLDAERVAAAEAQVEAWREANDLQLPDFRPDLVAEIDDTLDYPPAGSAARAAQGAPDGAGGAA